MWRLSSFGRLLLLSVTVYVDDGMFILVPSLVSKFTVVEKYFEPMKNSWKRMHKNCTSLYSGQASPDQSWWEALGNVRHVHQLSRAVSGLHFLCAELSIHYN